MKVLVSDNISQAGIDILKDNGVDVTFNTELSYEELLEEIGKYDGIILRSMTPLNEEVLSQADNLKVIARAGSGYDNIDVEAASKRGIIVLNTPGQNTISAAEQTMALMLGLSRNLPQANEALHEGIWDRNKYQGVEINQKTLGIIGLGRVGGNVATRAKSFNMEVIANDPYIPAERGEKLGVELVGFKEVLKRSDYISIHTPLTDETYHILGKKEFAQMKEGVRIVNAARGENVDTYELAEAIKEGKVAGAALDVHEEEPLKEEHPLLELEDRVIVSPHLGGTTVEAMDNVAIDAAKQAISVLRGDLPRTPLNAPALQPEAMKEIEPYVNLAKKLGAFYAQWGEGRIKELTISYRGELAEKEIGPVTTALLIGILNPILDTTVNSVNAGLIAEERGIDITESKSSTTERYSSLIELKVETEAGVNNLVGTVFDDTDLRIVEINGYRVNAISEGNLLITNHTDKPGVVGKIGTLLGENDINIANMQLGRHDAGGEAVMVMGIDNELNSEVKEKLLTIDGISDIKEVNL
ncbi:phosphoglycerate dehydrogenase [Acetohalobium arabaticum]|uniref:D-3-phosphoglycerate dehydrogenase n=1 Tax=Acetohalobium arabaticum (strain ATCC 49924 / DSM 5501 / Z-7288) TaxID=574087 RepID=D9QSC3_ACEAZ|nr:phosphoglycerate dehydrogenase [Acetohalobium arabaticum]ADL11579.1 D-3-phosphoglycerate dehydrogenase [Acetohalobium arabaticum DSM 5501]